MTGKYLPLGASSGYLRLGANAPGVKLDLEYAGESWGRMAFKTDGTIEVTSGEGPSPHLNPSVDATLTSGEVARKSGFTGNSCDHCGSMMMVQTGHCETCQSCFTTTGCS